VLFAVEKIREQRGEGRRCSVSEAVGHLRRKEPITWGKKYKQGSLETRYYEALRSLRAGISESLLLSFNPEAQRIVAKLNHNAGCRRYRK
jgi:hypothetical protein